MDLRSVQESPIQWHKQRGSSCLVYVFRENLFRALHSLTRVLACTRTDSQKLQHKAEECIRLGFATDSF